MIRTGQKPHDLRFRVVELRGFEPLTPSMRTRCATGLRYSPKSSTWARLAGQDERTQPGSAPVWRAGSVA
jgi:hypothetical protein